MHKTIVTVATAMLVGSGCSSLTGGTPEACLEALSTTEELLGLEREVTSEADRVMQATGEGFDSIARQGRFGASREAGDRIARRADELAATMDEIAALQVDSLLGECRAEGTPPGACEDAVELADDINEAIDGYDSLLVELAANSVSAFLTAESGDPESAQPLARSAVEAHEELQRLTRELERGSFTEAVDACRSSD